MRMTSMDINNKDFRKSLFRGYNQNDVEDFLERVADDYEAVFKENSSLKEKISILNERIEHYTQIENSIQNTLVLAQNAAEQAKLSAQKEAELIVRTANESAQKILDKANDDVVKVYEDFEKVKHEFSIYRMKYRNFMSTQNDMFTSLEGEFAKKYELGDAAPQEVSEKQAVTQEVNEQEDNEDDLNNIKSFYVRED